MTYGQDGAIVILSTKAYTKEMSKQLQVSQTYLKLLSNPTLTHKKELDKLVKKGKIKGFLNEKEAKYPVPNTCRIPVIYILPKIQK